jgi:hypothetical protein
MDVDKCLQAPIAAHIVAGPQFCNPGRHTIRTKLAAIGYLAIGAMQFMTMCGAEIFCSHPTTFQYGDLCGRKGIRSLLQRTAKIRNSRYRASRLWLQGCSTLWYSNEFEQVVDTSESGTIAILTDGACRVGLELNHPLIFSLAISMQ